MTENSLFTIRPLSKEDVPFIYNSWLKSYRDSPMVKSIPNTIYYAEHHKVIENLLRQPGCLAGVACNPEDANQIYGYVVGETLPGIPDPCLCIHWVYCKHPFRGNGIAKALFQWIGQAKSNVYTHRVKNVEKLIGERPFTFNPYLLNRVA